MFAAVGGLVATDAAFAKIDVDKLTLGGEARVRAEYRVGTQFGTTFTTSPNGQCPGPCTGGQSNESAFSQRIRVNVGYDLTPDVSFFAQLQDARVWGSENATGALGANVAASGIGAVSSANGNNTGVDLHQGYILVKNILTPGLSAKMGRQEIIFGDHRLFGNFGWSQIGNSFDAIRLTHSTAFADVDLFWARIAESEATGLNHGVIFNGGGVKGTSDQDIYGLYVTLKPMPNWTLEPYYFLLKDSRPAVAGAFVTVPQAPDQARNVLGGRLNGKAGGLDTTFEAVWQFGGISSGQNRLGAAGGFGDHDMHINAHAEAFKLGYTFEPVPMKPRIGIEVDYASGDNCVNATGAASCAAKGHYNTFDNLYPTNHFHYGYMDLMSWRNMVNYALVLDVKPDPVSKVQVNFILHRLARAQDNWYRAGQVIYGASCSSTTGGACVGGGNTAQSLGKELDIHYFRTFKEKFKFEVGYGHFFTGQYFEQNVGKNPTGSKGPVSTLTFNQDADQNWGYVMGSVLF
jgi:hypothetical protein